MDTHQHHQDIIDRVSEQLKDVLGSSEQGIYIYLDDVHKACNKKFASLLGYASPKEWAQTEGNFPDRFADHGSQEALVSAYGKAMERMVASTIKISWKKKAGGTVETIVILVPIEFEGHLLALHFVID